jgi:4-hydroxy-3-polyprenylbenzoate decarboxylase
MRRERIVVGISGASGVVIGIRTVEELLKAGREVHVIVTDAAREVIRHEVGKGYRFPKGVRVHAEDAPRAPLNSTSFVVDAMAVAPCSVKSLSALASGYANNLLTRCADGVLRTGRKLVVVPRETPLSLAALENMAQLKRGGAIILPPCAAYYFGPRTADDMTDFFVGKILDCLGVEHALFRRWGGK